MSMTMDMGSALQRVLNPGRGRKNRRDRESEKVIADLILEIDSRLDFRVSARGWCYILEDYGLPKDCFDRMQRCTTVWRKSGLLPLDICAEDDARKLIGIEDLDFDDVEDEADRIEATVKDWINGYLPFSFWEDKGVFLLMVVEKIDLVGLFSPVCRKYHVPIANARGWSDLNLRAAMMQQFKKSDDGRDLVVLYCGDHDPPGLVIADSLKRNMVELSDAVGWDPSGVIVDRFGLTSEFINEQGLTWVDNLISSSGRDLASPTHKGRRNEPHFTYKVPAYLAKYGEKKCEANALVVRQDAGRQLCEDAIKVWLPDADQAVEAYEESLEPLRQKLRDEVERR